MNNSKNKNPFDLSDSTPEGYESTTANTMQGCGVCWPRHKGNIDYCAIQPKQPKFPPQFIEDLKGYVASCLDFELSDENKEAYLVAEEKLDQWKEED